MTGPPSPRRWGALRKSSRARSSQPASSPSGSPWRAPRHRRALRTQHDREHVVVIHPPVHDDPRDRGARADARGHAGGHRPLDRRRDLPLRERARRRERGLRPWSGGRDARLPRPRGTRRPRQRGPRRDRETEPADRHAGRRADRARIQLEVRAREHGFVAGARIALVVGVGRSLSGSAPSSGRAPRSRVAVALVLRYTTAGRRFQAVGANPRAAWMAGLRVRTHVVFAYTAAGILYAVAAILLAGVRISIDPAFGASYLLAPIAAVVLAGAALSGGLASATSTWVAALALTFLTRDAAHLRALGGAAVHRVRRRDHRRNAGLGRPGGVAPGSRPAEDRAIRGHSPEVKENTS